MCFWHLHIVFFKNQIFIYLRHIKLDKKISCINVNWGKSWWCSKWLTPLEWMTTYDMTNTWRPNTCIFFAQPKMHVEYLNYKMTTKGFLIHTSIVYYKKIKIIQNPLSPTLLNTCKQHGIIKHFGVGTCDVVLKEMKKIVHQNHLL
jgi:hypothetical protein